MGTNSEIVADPGASTEDDTFGSAVLEFDFEPRGVGEVAVGYEYRGFRLELSGGYREAGVGQVTILEGGGRERLLGLDETINGKTTDEIGVGFHGRTKTISAMLNLMYGYNFGTVTPFIGGGIGLAHVTAHIIETASLDSPGAPVDITQGSDVVLAFQAIARVEANVTDDLSLTLTYTYFDTKDPLFYKPVSANVRFYRGFDVSSHNIMIGLRYRF